jgi:hypothetical protein
MDASPLVWLLPDGSTVTEAEHDGAMTAAMADDEWFFNDHPHAYGRLRAPYPGEFAPLGLPDDAVWGTLVRQVGAARLCEPLASGLRPGPILLDWDEVSGEVYSLHTDFPSVLDGIHAALAQHARETTPTALEFDDRPDSPWDF